jgi:putative transcriptional regulator
MENELARFRQDSGLTQEALGRALGVSRQTIISIEKGRFDPSLPLVFRMSEFFGCRIEDLFTPEGSK